MEISSRIHDIAITDYIAGLGLMDTLMIYYQQLNDNHYQPQPTRGSVFFVKNIQVVQHINKKHKQICLIFYGYIKVKSKLHIFFSFHVSYYMSIWNVL